ncbi:MAG: DUF4440 domain-containing protein [Acidobacteriota bacterium]
MRSRTLTILALAASAVCLGANAQEEKAGPDIEANRALDARFFKALEAMDLETLAASYSKSEMVTSVSEDGSRQRGPAEIKAGYQQLLGSLKSIKIESYDTKFSRISDTAIAGYGEAIGVIVPKDGPAQSMKWVYTDVRRKEGGKWVYLFDRVITQPATTATDSLYKRLGGYDAIAAVIDDFIPRLAGDPQLKRFFGGLSALSAVHLRQHLVNQVCAAAGGPCAYTGRDMKTAHAGLGINGKDWDAGVKALVATLDKFKVRGKTREDLLAAVSSLKGDIVEKP